MKRVKYEIPQIRVFQVVETEGILAGSDPETTFKRFSRKKVGKFS